MNTRFGKNGVIERCKGIEMLGILFGSPIGPEEFILEKQTHLRHHGITVGVGSSYFHCRNQIFLGIGTEHTDGQLRTGKNNGFGKSLEHKTQCRSRIRHGICAMKHNKSVELSVVVLNNEGNPLPGIRSDVR